MNKEFKPVKIPGLQELYSVSKDGRIYSKRSSKILKQATNKKGYKIVCLRNSSLNIAQTISVHRVVAITYIDNPNQLETVDHIDNNKENNHVDNLRWMTREGNSLIGINKRIKEGTHPLHVNNYWIGRKHKQSSKNKISNTRKKLGFHGDKSPVSKVSDADVVEIRNKYKSSSLFKKPYQFARKNKLAEKHNVSEPTIIRILTNKSRKHLI